MMAQILRRMQATWNLTQLRRVLKPLAVILCVGLAGSLAWAQPDPAARCPTPEQIVKSDPDRVYGVGETIYYKILVRNTSGVLIKDVSVDEPMLPRMENVLYCWSGDLSFRGSMRDLGPGETLILLGDYVVTQADVDANDTIENVATIASATSENGEPLCSAGNPACSSGVVSKIGEDPSGGVAPIPTLDRIGLLLMMLLMGGAALYWPRRPAARSGRH